MKSSSTPHSVTRKKCVPPYDVIHADVFPPWIEHRQLVSWVLKLVAVDVVLLLAWTLVDRLRRVDVVELLSSGVGEHK